MCEMLRVDGQGGFLTAARLWKHREAPAGGPVFGPQVRGGGALSCYLRQVREENLQRRCDSAICHGSGFAAPHLCVLWRVGVVGTRQQGRGFFLESNFLLFSGKHHHQA